MSYEEYTNALKMGEKEYRVRLQKGDYPYLPAIMKAIDKGAAVEQLEKWAM